MQAIDIAVLRVDDRVKSNPVHTALQVGIGASGGGKGRMLARLCTSSSMRARWLHLAFPD